MAYQKYLKENPDTLYSSDSYAFDTIVSINANSKWYHITFREMEKYFESVDRHKYAFGREHKHSKMMDYLEEYITDNLKISPDSITDLVLLRHAGHLYDEQKIDLRTEIVAETTLTKKIDNILNNTTECISSWIYRDNIMNDITFAGGPPYNISESLALKCMIDYMESNAKTKNFIVDIHNKFVLPSDPETDMLKIIKSNFNAICAFDVMNIYSDNLPNEEKSKTLNLKDKKKIDELQTNLQKILGSVDHTATPTEKAKILNQTNKLKMEIKAIYNNNGLDVPTDNTSSNLTGKTKYNLSTPEGQLKWQHQLGEGKLYNNYLKENPDSLYKNNGSNLFHILWSVKADGKWLHFEDNDFRDNLNYMHTNTKDELRQILLNKIDINEIHEIETILAGRWTWKMQDHSYMYSNNDQIIYWAEKGLPAIAYWQFDTNLHGIRTKNNTPEDRIDAMIDFANKNEIITYIADFSTTIISPSVITENTSEILQSNRKKIKTAITAGRGYITTNKLINIEIEITQVDKWAIEDHNIAIKELMNSIDHMATPAQKLNINKKINVLRSAIKEIYDRYDMNVPEKLTGKTKYNLSTPEGQLKWQYQLGEGKLNNTYLKENPDTYLSTGKPFFFINDTIYLRENPPDDQSVKNTHAEFFKILMATENFTENTPIQAIGRKNNTLLSYWPNPEEKGVHKDNNPLIAIDNCTKKFISDGHKIESVEYMNNTISIDIWLSIDFDKLKLINYDNLDTLFRFYNFEKFRTSNPTKSIINTINGISIPDNDIESAYSEAVQELKISTDKLNANPNWPDYRLENLQSLIQAKTNKVNELNKLRTINEIKKLENSITHEMSPTEKLTISNKIRELQNSIKIPSQKQKFVKPVPNLSTPEGQLKWKHTLGEGKLYNRYLKESPDDIYPSSDPDCGSVLILWSINANGHWYHIDQNNIKDYKIDNEWAHWSTEQIMFDILESRDQVYPEDIKHILCGRWVPELFDIEMIQVGESWFYASMKNKEKYIVPYIDTGMPLIAYYQNRRDYIYKNDSKPPKLENFKSASWNTLIEAMSDFAKEEGLKTFIADFGSCVIVPANKDENTLKFLSEYGKNLPFDHNEIYSTTDIIDEYAEYEKEYGEDTGDYDEGEKDNDEKKMNPEDETKYNELIASIHTLVNNVDHMMSPRERQKYIQQLTKLKQELRSLEQKYSMEGESELMPTKLKYNLSTPEGQLKWQYQLGESKDILPGGKADDMSDDEYSIKQLKKGLQIEREHTDNPQVAKEIVKDHLQEIPDYYDRLEQMEKDAGIVEAKYNEVINYDETDEDLEYTENEMDINLKVGDTIKTGKYRNKPAKITGFDADDKGQPEVKTNKGTRKVLGFRADKYNILEESNEKKYYREIYFSDRDETGYLSYLIPESKITEFDNDEITLPHIFNNPFFRKKYKEYELEIHITSDENDSDYEYN